MNPNISFFHFISSIGLVSCLNLDQFSKLGKCCRHSKTQSAPSHSAGMSSNEDAASSSGSNNALVLFDAPAPATPTSNTKEQDLIDLLSIVLTTSPNNSETPEAPNSTPTQNAFEVPYSWFYYPFMVSQYLYVQLLSLKVIVHKSVEKC